MNMDDEQSARRVEANVVSRGVARRLTASSGAGISADELDHRLGFDLGYRDGLARATAEAETAAIEARVNWEAQAQVQLDTALAELTTARERLTVAADALNVACLDERDWAVGLAVEIAYAAVARLLGERHAQNDLIGALCARVVQDIPERPLRLRVSPDDVEAVSAHVRGMSVDGDERLSRGACVLETPRGRVVAGLAERLSVLRDTLLAVVGAGSGSSGA